MKISMITIAFNSEKTIEDTIRSVITQKASELEYIIIDSKSTDKTIDIVDKYKDNRFKVISEKDGGISDAFNKGVKLATGEIIGIINSDDVLMPEALTVVEKTFDSQPDTDIVYGNVIRFMNTVNDGYEVKPCTDLEKMKYKFLLNHPAIFIRKSAYQKYGFFSLDYKCAMDYELISKMYFSGAKFFYLDKALAAFREGGVSDVKFTQTMREHKIVAKRNGAGKVQLFLHICKLYLRRYLLRIAKSLKVEKVLRKYIKKQRYSK